MNATIKERMCGAGLRHQHFNELAINPNRNIDFFEIISENFMDTKGRPLEVLNLLKQKYPISMHGVSLSIGSHEKINLTYLDQLKEFADELNPFLISDHLCFTGLAQNNLHNLLPITYNEENLYLISKKIDFIQNKLERSFLLENLSAYFTLKKSTMTEAEFLTRLAQHTGCGILLDVNNLYVNSINQNFSIEAYLSQINFNFVKEFHLAGYSDFGEYLFDTHANPVFDPVWSIYDSLILKYPHIPTLIEWDENIPPFERLEEEVMKAKKERELND